MIYPKNRRALPGLSPSGNLEGAPASLKMASWMQSKPASSDQAMSANEISSLTALIAYVAYNSGENEYGVERRLSDRFRIPNVKCLSSQDFDAAIRYLMDERVKGIEPSS